MADCATWWLDHTGETYMYVAATKQKDPRLQGNAVTKLVDGATEWGELLGLPQAGKLMSEHVALVKHVTDLAFAGEAGSVDPYVEALLENVRQQADLYEKTIPGFPRADFEKLFTTHVTSTGGYILALASRDMPDFQKNYNNMVQNRNQLAKFWGRICLILKK